MDYVKKVTSIKVHEIAFLKSYLARRHCKPYSPKGLQVRPIVMPLLKISKVSKGMAQVKVLRMH